MTQFLTPAPPRALAHRGFAVRAPENTMLAFAAAVSLGVTHIETDVHASADGVAVIAHDPALDRVAGHDVEIERTMLAALRQIDLGQEQHVPTLREALLAFPDARFNIDMKSDASVVPCVRAVIEAKAEQRVLLTAFSERRRAQAAGLIPGVATSASPQMLVKALAARAFGMQRAMTRALESVVAVQVPRSRRGVPIVTPSSVEAFHRAGVEVHVWTINDQAEMRELYDMGVDAVVTDRADLALEVLAERR